MRATASNVFLRLSAASLVASLFLTACRKPDDDLGLDLLPGSPLGTVVDTLELHAFTFADSSIRTSGLSRQLLGSCFDPQFGKLKVDLVTQIRLSANNIGTGLNAADLRADSMVLALAFDGANYAYGNLNPQVFQVFEVNESLSLDSSYRSNRITARLSEDLVQDRGGRITPHPLSKPYIGGDSLNPQLRIRLTSTLAERFLAAFNTSSLADNTGFAQFFKGFYITTDNSDQLPNEGGILYFNLLSADSKVTLYYHDVNEPTEALKLDFLINSNCVRYVTVQHDFEQATDGGLLAALADTVAAAPRTYIRTLGGTRTAIRFPDLMQLADKDQVLAKAELILPVQGSYYPYYPPPAQLFLFRKDSTGTDTYLPDQFGGLGIIVGFYRSSENAYRFNITRYVQRVLEGSIPNTGVEVISGSTGITANRVVLNGPAAAQDPMRLRLTFTSY